MIFIEVKITPKNEDEPREGEQEKMEFELGNAEFNSMDEGKSYRIG